ncbi:MAG: NAD-dependent epimerase/dehydratase family protein [Pirellulales bacterium]
MQNDQVLVTGATGFIGTILLRKLLARGCRVRALTRRDPGQAPPGMASDPELQARAARQLEWVQGDVLDAPSLVRAAAGCRRIFHLAAYAKNWAPQREIFQQFNVGGLRNVIAAAREVGVERVVWTSTMLTLGTTRRDEVADESRPRPSPHCLTDYEASKVAAEEVAREAVSDGVPIVIVNPARVFGPGHLTEGNALAQLIDDYDRGRFPILLNAGVNVGNYVFVDDVAEGHLLAMERGRVGERYILGGENVSLRQFFRTIDEVSGKRHWQIPIFRPGALFFSWMQLQRARWFGVYPTITPGWVRTFLTDWNFTSAKAQRELGYQYLSLREGLERTVTWLRALRAARGRRT